MMARLIPYLWIIGMGLGWGATLPLTKVAVSTGHPHLGLIFWQFVLGSVGLGLVTTLRRRGLPLRGVNIRFYVIIALIGTLIPNLASYQALSALPSGIYAILIALVPMLALPMALALGSERFAWRRLSGLALGLIAVLMIIGLPEALPDRSLLIFVLIGMIPPLFYAFEGNFVAKWGTGGAGPIQLLLGASIVGAVLTLPWVLWRGEFISPLRPWGIAEWAFIGSAVIHTVVYTCYVLVIRRYGAVFGEQVGYIVTAAGVGWSIVLLSEWYSGPVWAALSVMLLGLYLVQPKEGGAEDPR